jgi:hypothetical protein
MCKKSSDGAGKAALGMPACDADKLVKVAAGESEDGNRRGFKKTGGAHDGLACLFWGGGEK